MQTETANMNALRSLAIRMDADAVVACIDAECLDDLCVNDIDSAVNWLDEQLGNAPSDLSDDSFTQAETLLERLIS